MSGGARILAVDDEPEILQTLETILLGAGYDVVAATNGEDALAEAALRVPDAVILDLVLPDRSGIEVCRELRTWTAIPILLLSVVGDEDEKVRALDVGADDYVTKPFGVNELLARLRAALRRMGSPAGPILDVGELRIDFDKHAVSRGGELVPLTAARVQAPGAVCPQPGQALDPPHDPPRGLGALVPERAPLRPRLRLQAPPQDRARSSPPALPPHRVRSRISLRRLGPDSLIEQRERRLVLSLC
jgi:two-component system KDP operon response regulator KdpE